MAGGPGPDQRVFDEVEDWPTLDTFALITRKRQRPYVRQTTIALVVVGFVMALALVVSAYMGQLGTLLHRVFHT